MLEKGQKKLGQKKKKLGRLESGSQKDGLTTKGNACGHCGEASAKLNELIAGPNKLLDLAISVGKETTLCSQDKISVQALGDPSERLEQRAS